MALQVWAGTFKIKTIIILFQTYFHFVVMYFWVSRVGLSTHQVQCQWCPFYAQVMPNFSPSSQADPIEICGMQDTIHQPTSLEFCQLKDLK